MTIWRAVFREATEVALIGAALCPNTFSAKFQRLGWFLFKMGFAVAVILGIVGYMNYGHPVTGDPGESLAMIIACVAVIVFMCGLGIFMVLVGTVFGWLFSNR